MDGIVSLESQGRIGMISLHEKMGPPIPTGSFGEIPNRYENNIYYPGSNQHISNGECTLEPFPNPLKIKPKKF
ncbi:MAG: hypothetical protein QG556_1042 [Pseudomonadota bacterium]|jgi:hypothetical protein|nr:hypothetical protein [Pseudomonadota bacterium]